MNLESTEREKKYNSSDIIVWTQVQLVIISHTLQINLLWRVVLCFRKSQNTSVIFCRKFYQERHISIFS